MRFAIITDVHSNIQALEACLKIIDQENIDTIACLGDVAGYNANPSECIKIIRDRAKYCIMGNHDDMISESEKGSYRGMRGMWSQDAMDGALWSRANITDDEKEWLANLEADMDIYDDKSLPFLMVHGSPYNLDEPYPYILSGFDSRLAYKAMKELHESIRVCFFGHTHIPTFARCVTYQVPTIDCEMGIEQVASSVLNIGTEAKPVFDISDAEDSDAVYICNPGSIGQPRCSNPTCFVVLDTESKTIEFQPFEYDVEGAQKAIYEAGYSEHIATRLVEDGITWKKD